MMVNTSSALLVAAAAFICCLQTRVNAQARKCSDKLCTCNEVTRADNSSQFVVKCENVTLNTVPVCTGHGLNCEQPYHLIISSNDLTALSIPKSVSNTLKRLTVTDNPIVSWKMFDQIEFQQLQRLTIHRVNMSERKNILTNSDTLWPSNLEVLHLTYCSLHSLEHFTQFRWLFRRLHWLSLRGNHFETFPSDYFDEILFVDLRDNWIKTVDFSTFSRSMLPFANAVDFSGNPITYFDVSTITDQIASIRLERTHLSDFDFAAWNLWKMSDTRRLRVHLHGTLLACSCHQAQGLLEMHAAGNESKLVLRRGSEPCGVVGDCFSCGYPDNDTVFNGGEAGLKEYVDGHERCLNGKFEPLEEVTPSWEVTPTELTSTMSPAFLTLMIIAAVLAVAYVVVKKRQRSHKEKHTEQEEAAAVEALKKKSSGTEAKVKQSKLTVSKLR